MKTEPTSLHSATRWLGAFLFSRVAHRVADLNIGKIKMKPLDREGRSDLHYAARDGDLKAVEKPVWAGADVNLQDRRGWSPLHFAAQACAADVASYLIAHGALVDLEDSFGNTPLSTATFNSRSGGDVIRVLRSAGADPRRKHKSGVSPLSLARSIANFNVAQFYGDPQTPNRCSEPTTTAITIPAAQEVAPAVVVAPL